MDSSPQPFDAVIVGAGPAGCSAASWAAQTGLRVAVVERGAEPCVTLAGMAFAQDWVLGHASTPLQVVGQRLAAHARQQPGIEWHLGATLAGVERADGRWRVSLQGGPMLEAPALVLATGTRAVRPDVYFGNGAAVMDASGLTAQREHMLPCQVPAVEAGQA